MFRYIFYRTLHIGDWYTLDITQRTSWSSGPGRLFTPPRAHVHTPQSDSAAATSGAPSGSAAQHISDVTPASTAGPGRGRETRTHHTHKAVNGSGPRDATRLGSSLTVPADCVASGLSHATSTPLRIPSPRTHTCGPSRLLALHPPIPATHTHIHADPAPQGKSTAASGRVQRSMRHTSRRRRSCGTTRSQMRTARPALQAAHAPPRSAQCSASSRRHNSGR